MYQHKMSETLAIDGISVTKTQLVEAGGKAGVNETIPDSSTDLAVAFALDVSECTSLFILSDQDLTIETNDGSSPDDTINLKANVPYLWHEDSYHDLLLTADAETLYVTNSSGEDA